MIVAPDFLCQAGLAEVLASAAGGDLTDSGTAFYREIDGTGLGVLSIVFQVVQATDKGEALLDGFGRAVDRIQGVVLRASLVSNAGFPKAVLEQARGYIEHAFLKFWEESSPVPPLPSAPLDSATESEVSQRIRLLSEPPYVLGGSRRSASINLQPKFELTDEFSTNEQVDSLLFLEGAKSIAVLEKNFRFLEIWDLDHQCLSLSGRLLNKQKFGGMAKVGDGTLALVENDAKGGQVWLWSPERPNHDRTEQTPGLISALSASEDGSLLVCGLVSGALGCWRWQPPSGWLARRGNHEFSVTAVAIEPRGKFVVSGDERGIVNLWELREDGLVEDELKPSRHKNSVTSIAFSPTANLVATADVKGEIYIEAWDVVRDASKLSAHTGAVFSIAFSPDGQFLISGGADGKILLWQIESGTITETLDAHRSSITCVTSSPDGSLLATAEKDGRVCIWRYPKH